MYQEHVIQLQSMPLTSWNLAGYQQKIYGSWETMLSKSLYLSNFEMIQGVFECPKQLGES